MTDRDSSKIEKDNKLQISNLQGSIDTQIRNNDNQYQRNQTELHNIDSQLGELKTQVATDELRKKITALQDQLDKSLAPTPKASLTFSLRPTGVAVDQIATPVTDVALPPEPDGSVRVEFLIMNFSNVDALDGDINLLVCDACKFAKEPEGFRRLSGQTDTQRNMPFQRILAKSQIPNNSVYVMPPPGSQGFEIGIIYRCRTCTIEKELRGIVHIRYQ